MSLLFRSISPWRNGRAGAKWLLVILGAAEAALAVLLLAGLLAPSSSRPSLRAAETPLQDSDGRTAGAAVENSSGAPAKAEKPRTDALMQAVALAASQGFSVGEGKIMPLKEPMRSWTAHIGHWGFHAGSQPALGFPPGEGFMLVYGWDPGAQVHAGFLRFGEQGGVQVLGYRAWPDQPPPVLIEEGGARRTYALSLAPRTEGETRRIEEERGAPSERKPSFDRALRLAPRTEGGTRPIVRALQMAVEVFERERFVVPDFTRFSSQPERFDSDVAGGAPWSELLLARRVSVFTIMPDSTDTMVFLFGPGFDSPEYSETNGLVLVHPDGAVTYAGIRRQTAEDAAAEGKSDVSESVLPGLTNAFAIACRALDSDAAKNRMAPWETRTRSIRAGWSTQENGWGFTFFRPEAGLGQPLVIVDAAGKASILW